MPRRLAHLLPLALVSVGAALAVARVPQDAETAVVTRRHHGADPLLIEELHRRGILLRLVAYGGWNTAGNALGSVVAAAAAIQIGRAAGTLDAAAARRVLLHRLIEDFAYMTDARRPLNAPRATRVPAPRSAVSGHQNLGNGWHSPPVGNRPYAVV